MRSIMKSFVKSALFTTVAMGCSLLPGTGQAGEVALKSADGTVNLVGELIEFKDDAYITFRYAENLALHGELTWNLGEDPVEGFTSMSWVLVHAPLIALGLDPVPGAFFS